MGAAGVLLGQVLHYEIKSRFSLADKSDDIVDIYSTTSSNMAYRWRLGECWDCRAVGKKLYKGMEAPHSSLAAASVTMKINNVTRLFYQCS